MGSLLLVAVGGALGAVSRYLISSALLRRFGAAFPYGTLLVNVLGCFVMGALMVWVLDRPDLSEKLRLVVGLGFLGSLTTFSTFGYETVFLFEQGASTQALGNVALNVVVGLAAVVAGQVAMRAVTG